MTPKGNGTPQFMDDETPAVCASCGIPERTTRIERVAMRAESDAVAASAAVRQEGRELRRLLDNMREVLTDMQRSQHEIVGMLRAQEDKC